MQGLMTRGFVRNVALGLLCSLGAMSVAQAQQIDFFCDCDAGLGPCGNGVTTDVPGGCLNSIGVKAFFFANGGGVSVSADDLVLVAGNLPTFQFGLGFMGGGATSLPFGDGLRCVAPGSAGLYRLPVQNSGASGVIAIGPGLVAFTASHFPPPGQIQAGQTWKMQVMYRDPAGPCGSGFNLTNALSIRFAL
jgi:hypothetical protein